MPATEAKPSAAPGPASDAKPSPHATPPTGADTSSTADEALGAAGPLDQLRAAWPRVVERIGRNPANRPLIMACRPVEIRDGIVVLGFPESQAFLRDIAERKRTVLEEALAGVLGRPVAVRCVATNIELTDPLEGDRGSEELVSRARQIFADDLVDVADVE